MSKLEKGDLFVRPCLLFCNVSSNVRLFFILSLVKTVIIACLNENIIIFDG